MKLLHMIQLSSMQSKHPPGFSARTSLAENLFCQRASEETSEEIIQHDVHADHCVHFIDTGFTPIQVEVSYIGTHLRCCGLVPGIKTKRGACGGSATPFTTIFPSFATERLRLLLFLRILPLRFQGSLILTRTPWLFYPLEFR